MAYSARDKVKYHMNQSVKDLEKVIARFQMLFEEAEGISEDLLLKVTPLIETGFLYLECIKKADSEL